jgi:peptidoglycan/xylan/chitin deacetylase (PgdA/CDA1 family)
MGVRADKIISVRVVQPVLRLFPKRQAIRVPILMYHSISSDIDSGRAPYYRTVTSPEVFARHVELLRSGAYQVITLTQALAALGGRFAVAGGRIPVVITFDDGLRDYYTHAFPVLRSAGMASTVFLTTGYIDGRFPTGVPCLRSAEVKQLAQQGVEFGSHTVSHSRLVDLSIRELERELADSKSHVEDLIGSPVGLFSYPYRFPQERMTFQRSLRERLLANGYSAGVTTVVGRAAASDDALFLPRIPANDCDDDTLLRAKLEGAYDWLGPPQMVYKRSRALLAKASGLLSKR